MTHFQTPTRLSKKKKRKRKTQTLIKTPSRLSTQQNKKQKQTKTKKKKRNTKTQTLKPKPYFPIKIQTQTCDSSLHFHIHTDQASIFQPIKQTQKKKKPLQQWKPLFVLCNSEKQKSLFVLYNNSRFRAINHINQLKKQACLPYGERGREQSGKNTNERLEKDIVIKRHRVCTAPREK